ncbi:MAG: histidine phosphatase family protein [Chloroflexota bacterium]|nr:histidine phosphatase family protein [Chloroflexota bacterium]
MPATNVIFVRHADVTNPNNLMYGRLPRFRLSEQGLKDAEATAQALAEEPLAAIYTSPLIRAKQTARIIGRHHPEARIIESRSLVEIRTHFQGQAWSSFPRFPNFYDPEAGDETVVDVFRRMQALMFRLLREYPGQSVVCISHGDPIKILRLGYLGRPLTRESAGEPDPAKGCILRFIWVDPAGKPEITYFEPQTNRYLVGYWERLANRADVPPGTLKHAKLEGTDVVIANVEGQFFVLSGRCGHMNTLLHQGKLEGKCLTCPLHGSQYDVETGKVLREAQLSAPLGSTLDGQELAKLPTLPRRTYDVRLEGDDIFARIR